MVNSTNLANDWFDWSIWMSVLWLLLGLLSLPGNAIVIWVTVTDPNLNSKTANWFIFSLALSDFGFSVSLIFEGVVVHYPLSTMCAITAFFNISFIAAGFFLPAFLAIHRYAFLTNSPLAERFSKRNVLFMNMCCWLFPILAATYGIVGGRLGPDFGICGFIVVGAGLFLVALDTFYMFSVVGFYIIVYVYYKKITSWLNEQREQLKTSTDQLIIETVRDTESLMKMLRIVCIIPVYTQVLPIILRSVCHNTFLSGTPVLLARFIMLPFTAASLLNPWVTLMVVKPYKRSIAKSWVAVFVPSRFLERTVTPSSAQRSAVASVSNRKE